MTGSNIFFFFTLCYKCLQPIRGKEIAYYECHVFTDMCKGEFEFGGLERTNRKEIRRNKKKKSAGPLKMSVSTCRCTWKLSSAVNTKCM